MKLVLPRSCPSSESSSDDALSTSTSPSGTSDTASSFGAPPLVQLSHSINHCGKKVTLSGMRCDQVLYIYMSRNTLLNLSKQCLISFLDYAQEELKLQMALIFFERSLPDCKRLMHNFRFFGFQPISSDQIPSVCCGRRSLEASQRYHFMAYELEAETDDEDG